MWNLKNDEVYVGEVIIVSEVNFFFFVTTFVSNIWLTLFIFVLPYTVNIAAKTKNMFLTENNR